MTSSPLTSKSIATMLRSIQYEKVYLLNFAAKAEGRCACIKQVGVTSALVLTSEARPISCTGLQNSFWFSIFFFFFFFYFVFKLLTSELYSELSQLSSNVLVETFCQQIYSNIDYLRVRGHICNDPHKTVKLYSLSANTDSSRAGKNCRSFCVWAFDCLVQRTIDVGENVFDVQSGFLSRKAQITSPLSRYHSLKRSFLFLLFTFTQTKVCLNAF